MMKINPILREMIKYFSHLYGKRNSIYFPGLIDRIASLGIAIGDLQDIIRKDYSNNKKIGMALARIVGRIFCVADNFKTLNLSLAMVVKYPKDHCVYCNNYPCNCPENRPQPQFSYDTVKIQNIWTLENWQRHLMSVYGERNRKKGIENLLNRLSREVHELSSLRATIPGLNMSLDDIEMKFAM